MDKLDHTTADLLRQDFDLPEGRFSEAEVISWLAAKIEQLMQSRMEYLMSLCYTRDLNEQAVADALHPAAPVAGHLGLARLFYDRQRRRAYTKLNVQTPPIHDEDAW